MVTSLSISLTKGKKITHTKKKKKRKKKKEKKGKKERKKGDRNEVERKHTQKSLKIGKNLHQVTKPNLERDASYI